MRYPTIIKGIFIQTKPEERKPIVRTIPKPTRAECKEGK